jgi:hypothetical protein
MFLLSFHIYSPVFSTLIYSMIVFLAEASTPFLNLSWLLQKLGYESSTMFKLVAFILIVTFFVFRVLLSPYAVYHMIANPEVWGNQLIMYYFNVQVVAFFALINFFWFYKLVALALGSSKKKKAEPVSYAQAVKSGTKND